MKNIRGIVIEKGGINSHAIILARSLGLPALILEDARSILANSNMIILDGNEGIVIINPNSIIIEKYNNQLNIERRQNAILTENAVLPSKTIDNQQIDTMINIGHPDDLKDINISHIDGIGVFRTEFLFMGREELPSEEEQFTFYKEVVEKLQGKQVIIRTIDIGGDKDVPYLNLPEELNPFLGYRAIRMCLDGEGLKLFKQQIRAILRASVFGNVAIMIPMVSHLEQILKVKSIIQEVEQDLANSNIPFSKIQLGIMIEIPSSCLIADNLAKEVDFFSIGTNDLTQYTIAVDRMNNKVSNLYQELHPAVIKLIKMVVDAAEKNNKWVGICGELASSLIATELLIGLGIKELSMNYIALPRIKNKIRSISYSQAIDTANKTLHVSSINDVMDILEETKRQTV